MLYWDVYVVNTSFKNLVLLDEYLFPFPGDRTTQLPELSPCDVFLTCFQASLPATLWFLVSGPCLSIFMIVLALLQYPGSAGEHSSQLKNKLVVTMKGRSGYTFFQIAVYAFSATVTFEGTCSKE